MTPVAVIVVAVCALVAVLAALHSRRGFRFSGFGVKAEVDPIEKLKSIEAKVDQVNRAVNHQPDGTATLVQRVGSMEVETKAHREWEREVFGLLARQLGVDLPPHPDPPTPGG